MQLYVVSSREYDTDADMIRPEIICSTLDLAREYIEQHAIEDGIRDIEEIIFEGDHPNDIDHFRDHYETLLNSQTNVSFFNVYTENYTVTLATLDQPWSRKNRVPCDTTLAFPEELNNKIKAFLARHRDKYLNSC
jgi:hypothetical protein